MLKASSKSPHFGIRLLTTSTIKFNESKVSADELSSALRKRIRINSYDLKDSTDEDLQVPPQNRFHKRFDDVDKSIPDQALDHISKIKKSHQPKQKIIAKKISVKDEIKQVLPISHQDLPRLAHDLDAVLQKKGVHYSYLRRRKQFQFDKLLNKIDQLRDFKDIKTQITGSFVSPSKDEHLLKMAKESDSKYFSSTSSMTSTLFQFYLLLNNFDTRKPSPERFKFGKFTKLMSRVPSSIIVTRVNKKEDVFSVEVDKSCNMDSFLSEFGHIAEIILTNESKDIETFKQLYKTEGEIPDSDDPFNSDADLDQDPGYLKALVKYEKFKNPQNVYNLAKYDNFLMRSQLDCYHPDLPGNGTFDLKSRAISDIRFDLGNHNMKNTKYSKQFSYNSEFHDMIRSGALLKYGFQARIGQMDGIFLAIHNVRLFLAFEYLSLNDIDKVFFNGSPWASYIADVQFKFSIRMWRHLLDTIQEDLGCDSFRVVLKLVTKDHLPFSVMKVDAVKLTKEDKDELNRIQGKFTRSLRHVNRTLVKQVTRLQNERAKVLSDYREQLENFNKTLVKNGSITSYTIEVCHWVDNKKMNVSKLPTKDNKWVLEYRIIREKPNADEHLSRLSSLTKLVTHELKFRKRDKHPPSNRSYNQA